MIATDTNKSPVSILREALTKIYRNEVAVFDEDTNGMVMVPMDTDDMIELASVALAATERAAIQDAECNEVKPAGERFPDECIASGLTCAYGPHGRHGESQCAYCAKAAPAPLVAPVPDAASDSQDAARWREVVRNIAFIPSGCSGVFGLPYRAPNNYRELGTWMQLFTSVIDASIAESTAPAVKHEASAVPDAQGDASVIEESAQVLESAAAYNRSKGRTVLAHTQQDRANRLRQVEARPASPAVGMVALSEAQMDVAIEAYDAAWSPVNLGRGNKEESLQAAFDAVGMVAAPDASARDQDYLAAISSGEVDGMYHWVSYDGQQHDTGRVYFKKPENQHSSFFADTASPSNAKKIAIALNREILSATAASSGDAKGCDA